MMPDSAIKSIKRWIVIAGLALAVGILILASNAADERSHNCDLVQDAMRVNNEALVNAFIPEDRRTPELEERVTASLEQADEKTQPFFDQC